MSNRSLIRSAPALLLAVVAACHDATGTAPARFDASRVERGVAAVERVTSTTVLQSLSAIAPAAEGVAAAPRPWLPEIGEAAGRVMAGAQAGIAAIPVMRPGVLGTTFVYSPTQKRYVADPTRTGGPSNGVRFVLYALDADRIPIVGEAIGYADLTDQERVSPSAAGVRLVAVTGGVTRLDYAFTLSGSVADARASVVGFLSDGTDTITFDLTTAQQLFGRGGPTTLDGTLRLAGSDLSVAVHASGTAGEPAGDGAVRLTVTSASDAIDVQSTVARGVLDATVTVNNRLLARATGDPDEPVISGADGQPLDPDELRALGAIVHLVNHLLTFVRHLLEPAGGLLLIALGIGR